MGELPGGFGGAAEVHHDVCASSVECARDGGADSSGGSGDECGFAG